MRIVKQLLVLVSVLLLFATACTKTFTKDGYISNYEAWISTLKQEYRNYKESDWVKKKSEFKQYSETEFSRFKDNLTPEERQKIERLSGQYYAIMAKYRANQVKDELNSIMNTANGMFEELQNK